MNCHSLRKIMALTTSVLLLSACGNRMSLENYNKLKVGQSYEEIKEIMGIPASCDEAFGIRTCTWGDENRNIKIGLVSGRVMLLSAHGLN